MNAVDMEEARRRNLNAGHLAMKATAFDEGKLGPRIGVEIKVDGIGLLDVNGHVQSLEGVPFDCAAHLFDELKAIRDALGDQYVLHGEYIEGDGFNATLRAFKSGVGQGAVVLWDAVSLKGWLGYEQTAVLSTRRAQLQAAIDGTGAKMVRLVDQAPITRHSLGGALKAAVEDGHEGLVVKDLDSPYVRGPSPYWMKLKPIETVDAPIQAIRIEDGMIRSIVVTVDGKPAAVAAGIGDHLRMLPHEFEIGRMVEIKHVGKTERGALRGASFLRFRDDKGE